MGRAVETTALFFCIGIIFSWALMSIILSTWVPLLRASVLRTAPAYRAQIERVGVLRLLGGDCCFFREMRLEIEFVGEYMCEEYHRRRCLGAHSAFQSRIMFIFYRNRKIFYEMSDIYCSKVVYL